MFPIQTFFFRIYFASLLSECVEAAHLFRLERENNSPPRGSAQLCHINDCAKMRGQQSLLPLSLANTHLTFIAAPAVWSIHVWRVGFCPQGCFHTAELEQVLKCEVGAEDDCVVISLYG